MIPPIRRGTNTRTPTLADVLVFGVRIAAVKGYLTPFQHSGAGSGYFKYCRKFVVNGYL